MQLSYYKNYLIFSEKYNTLNFSLLGISKFVLYIDKVNNYFPARICSKKDLFSSVLPTINKLF